MNHWIPVASVTALLVAFGCVLASQDPPADDSRDQEQVDARLQYMVLIPAGEFRMGSLEDDRFAEDDEKPQRVMNLPAFYIDKLEVSNIEYKRFTDASGYPPPEAWEEGKYQEGADFYPVTAISWWDAAAYAKWAGKRLPTEAEWEKAARGTDARRFPWGDSFSEELANVEKDYAPVASYFEGASPYNVLNMAGNVAEWTATAYAAYPTVVLNVPDAFGGTSTTSNQPGESAVFRNTSEKDVRRARVDYEEGDPLLLFFTLDELADNRDRVYRGGSINNFSQFLRCANRERSNPKDRWYNIGFRCAMDPPTTSGH